MFTRKILPVVVMAAMAAPAHAGFSWTLGGVWGGRHGHIGVVVGGHSHPVPPPVVVHPPIVRHRSEVFHVIGPRPIITCRPPVVVHRPPVVYHEVIHGPRPPVVVKERVVHVEPADVTVWITNSNGSKSSVILTRSGQGYIGPRGEYYPNMPTNEQLRMVYGF